MARRVAQRFNHATSPLERNYSRETTNLPSIKRPIDFTILLHPRFSSPPPSSGLNFETCEICQSASSSSSSSFVIVNEFERDASEGDWLEILEIDRVEEGWMICRVIIPFIHYRSSYPSIVARQVRALVVRDLRNSFQERIFTRDEYNFESSLEINESVNNKS